MSILVDSTDPRGPKAVALAADSGQWLRCRDHAGRKAYGIPSSTGRGAYHLATRTSCTCKDFLYGRGRHCKHVLAVELVVQLAKERVA